MHDLRLRDRYRRVIEAIAPLVFDPDDVDDSPLPLVLADRCDGDDLESDIRSTDSGNPFPVLLLFEIAINDVVGDVLFWERLCTAFLDGKVSPWENLETRLAADDDLPAADELEPNVRALLRYANIELTGEPCDWAYLDRITSDVLLTLAAADGEFLEMHYCRLFVDATRYVNEAYRVSHLWVDTPRIDMLDSMPPLSQMSYPDIVAGCAAAWSRHGLSSETMWPTYKHPYKGGGFSCML